mgnify:CR=1 FL=1
MPNKHWLRWIHWCFKKTGLWNPQNHNPLTQYYFYHCEKSTGSPAKFNCCCAANPLSPSRIILHQSDLQSFYRGNLTFNYLYYNTFLPIGMILKKETNDWIPGISYHYSGIPKKLAGCIDKTFIQGKLADYYLRKLKDLALCSVDRKALKGSWYMTVKVGSWF